MMVLGMCAFFSIGCLAIGVAVKKVRRNTRQVTFHSLEEQALVTDEEIE